MRRPYRTPFCWADWRRPELVLCEWFRRSVKVMMNRKLVPPPKVETKIKPPKKKPAKKPVPPSKKTDGAFTGVVSKKNRKKKKNKRKVTKAADTVGSATPDNAG